MATAAGGLRSGQHDRFAIRAANARRGRAPVERTGIHSDYPEVAVGGAARRVEFGRRLHGDLDGGVGRQAPGPTNRSAKEKCCASIRRPARVATRLHAVFACAMMTVELRSTSDGRRCAVRDKGVCPERGRGIQFGRCIELSGKVRGGVPVHPRVGNGGSPASRTAHAWDSAARSPSLTTASHSTGTTTSFSAGSDYHRCVSAAARGCVRSAGQV